MASEKLLDPPEGIVFEATSVELDGVEVALRRFLHSQSLLPDLFEVTRNEFQNKQRLQIHLKSDRPFNGTLNLRQDPQLWIGNDVIARPQHMRRDELVPTVSLKEIFLCLATPGRTTIFRGEHASFKSLLDHLVVRQTTVLWAQRTGWGWPEGKRAEWNAAFWERGIPNVPRLTHAALTDMFLQPKKYEFGCYTAVKVCMATGLLDAYVRVLKAPTPAKRVLQMLWKNGSPLTHIEPQAIWSFEPEYDEKDLEIPGTILDVTEVRNPRHFVPGDWAYAWNTDPVSYQKTGYEGSNGIYLGGGQFSDYYNDNGYSFTFEQKLDEVYQWRHGVFSRQRDFEKAQKLSSSDYERLAQTPERGGLLLTWRLGPRLL